MIRTILVPLDGSELAAEAIGMAAAIARASAATIDLLMVHEPLLSAKDDPTWNERQIVAEQNYLRKIADELQSGGGVTSRQTLMRGKPAEIIALRAVDSGADLIVMTSHGRTGWSRAWLGSVADAVMRGTNVPVLMLPPMEKRHDRRAVRRRVNRIVVPLDGSAVAMEVQSILADLARAWNPEVALIRVVTPVPIVTGDPGIPDFYVPIVPDRDATELVRREAADELDRDAATLRQQGINIARDDVTVAGGVAQAIVDFALAREAEMIVMATHGRGKSRLLFGSVADKVRRASGLPVLLYRPRFARVAEPKMTAEAIREQLPTLSGVSGER